MAESEGLAEDLRRAQEMIARQSAEIDALRVRLGAQSFASELRQVLLHASAAAALSEPPGQDKLLELLVQTAAAVTGAAAGSLLEVDEAAGHLVFRAATGPKAAEVRRFTVPLGQGIAGFVAETGQPMAVSNVTEDARFYRDIGQSLNYIPQSMLCVPVRGGDTILGVIELLDKAGGVPFTARDMELVGSFVQQAAIAIEQSRSLHDLAGLLISALRQLTGESLSPGLESGARAFVLDATTSGVQSEAVALAATIAEIGRHGEKELALARVWLNSFLQYLRSRASYGF